MTSQVFSEAMKKTLLCRISVFYFRMSVMDQRLAGPVSLVFFFLTSCFLENGAMLLFACSCFVNQAKKSFNIKQLSKSSTVDYC